MPAQQTIRVTHGKVFDIIVERLFFQDHRAE